MTFRNLSAVLISSLLLSSAQADDPRADRILKAEMTRWDMSPQIADNDHLESVSVEINLSEQEALLTLQPEWCPPGRICSTLPRPPRIFRLPLVNVERNSCGAVIYTAEKDRRNSGGRLETLTLQDNRENRCPTNRVRPGTTGRLETVSREGRNNTSSSFEGRALIPSGRD